MIEETSLMMGFTFIVGIAFAYVLKLMTFFFSRLNGTEMSALLRKGRIWGRAYRMDIARTPPIRMRTARWTLWPNIISATRKMPQGRTRR